MTTMREPSMIAIVMLGLLDTVTVNAMQQEEEASGVTPTWALSIAVIPVLIITATVILSLEILNLTLVSRPLAALSLVAMWAILLTEELQISSILAAIVYHCVQEAYIEWTRGFPSIFQPQQARKITLWTLFWMRVFIWGATMATAGTFSMVTSDPHPLPASSSSTVARVFETVGSALLFTGYCECLEVLVMLYFADNEVKYEWRRRGLLWTASFSIGVAHQTLVLGQFVAWLQNGISSPVLVVLLLAGMGISMRVAWDRLLISTGLTSQPAQPADESKEADGGKEATTTATTAKRRSVLYHSNSIVETVELTAPHYDLRDATWDKRHALLHQGSIVAESG